MFGYFTYNAYPSIFKLPKTKPLIKCVQDALVSKFITYQQKTAQQLRQISQAIKDHMSDILNTIKNSLEKGGKLYNMGSFLKTF